MQRNDADWIFKYTLQEDFRRSSNWRSHTFRIPYVLYDRLVEELGEILTAQTTNFQRAIPAEVKMAAFLMYCGVLSYSSVACQLGIGLSTDRN